MGMPKNWNHLGYHPVLYACLLLVDMKVARHAFSSLPPVQKEIFGISAPSPKLMDACSAAMDAITENEQRIVEDAAEREFKRLYGLDLGALRRRASELSIEYPSFAKEPAAPIVPPVKGPLIAEAPLGSIGRKMTIVEVIALTSLPRSSLYRRIAQGVFPRAKLIGPKGTRRIAFDEAEILEWMADPQNYKAQQK